MLSDCRTTTHLKGRAKAVDKYKAYLLFSDGARPLINPLFVSHGSNFQRGTTRTFFVSIDAAGLLLKRVLEVDYYFPSCPHNNYNTFYLASTLGFQFYKEQSLYCETSRYCMSHQSFVPVILMLLLLRLRSSHTIPRCVPASFSPAAYFTPQHFHLCLQSQHVVYGQS